MAAELYTYHLQQPSGKRNSRPSQRARHRWMASTESIIRVLIRDHRVNRGEGWLRTINGAEGGPDGEKVFSPETAGKGGSSRATNGATKNKVVVTSTLRARYKLR